MNPLRAIFPLLLAAAAPAFAESQDFTDAPWLKPRSLQDFRSLLDRSPFSLPTAEETAEIEDRFFLTGVATINERPVVFVFDKTTQGRLMLEKFDAPGEAGRDRLLEYTPSIDPKNLTARVQIEGKVSQIRFDESTFQSQGGPQSPGQPPYSSPPGQPPPPGQPMSQNPGFSPQPVNPGQPMPPGQPPANPPGMAAAPQNPGAVNPGQPSTNEPPRRVIRRRVISNPQPGQ